MEDMGVESNKSSSSSTPPKKVIVRVADMGEDMLEHAIDVAATGFEKYAVKDDVAEYIKKMFDEFYGRSWHCIVGNFGCSVSHEKKQFVCFSLEGTAICLYKTGAIV